LTQNAALLIIDLHSSPRAEVAAAGKQKINRAGARQPRGKSKKKARAIDEKIAA
jgi:hypothetical protein